MMNRGINVRKFKRGGSINFQLKPHRFDFNEETGNDQKTRELAHRAQLNKINNYSVRLTAAQSSISSIFDYRICIFHMLF